MLRDLRCWKGIFSLAILTLLWGILPAASAERPVQPNAKRYTVSELSTVDVLEISGIELDKAAEEDLAKGPEKGPYRIGVAAEVNVQPGLPFGHEPTKATGQIRGTWERVKDGIYMWRLRVLSPGAKWLSFGFTQFNLPPEAALYVYSTDYQWVAGPYTAKDNEAHGQLWTPMIPGEEAVLELTAKAGEIDRITLVLGSVTHGYRGPVGVEKLDKSGSCNVDVVCSEGELWRNEIRSVGLYTFSISGGTASCTGTLINNTSQDESPYFLTANHCISESSVAPTVVVYWEYQSNTCRTPGSLASGTPLPRPGASQSGGILRATYANSDFCLLELDDPIDQQSHDVFWSGWDRTGADPTSAACIHHPVGDEKRISLENDPLTTTSYLGNQTPGDATHYRVADWDSGTTEVGSSGSGLWDQNRRLVGQLHGGYAACGNNESDWYGRLSVSWNGGGVAANRLRNWLDPAGTGVVFLNGYEGSGERPTQSRTRYSYVIQPMAFVDISTTGTDLQLEDDDYAQVPIPFGFPFFDRNFTSISVGSNGTLYFEDTYLGFNNTQIPAANQYGVSRFIAVFWDDLDPSAGGRVYYRITGSAPNRRFIAQWNNVPPWMEGSGGTFQAILYEGSGDILLQYLDTNFNNPSVNSGIGATVGVQDDAATGTQYSYNQPVLQDGLAVLFRRKSAGAGGAAVNLLLLD
jgi:hypothetical protein